MPEVRATLKILRARQLCEVRQGCCALSRRRHYSPSDAGMFWRASATPLSMLKTVQMALRNVPPSCAEIINNYTTLKGRLQDDCLLDIDMTF